MTASVQALPVGSSPPFDWWRRVSTTVNALLGNVGGLYQRQTAAVAGSYVVSATDYAIIVDATTADVTVTLPSPAQGRELVIKRVDGSSHAVSVSGSVDGGSTLSMPTQWQAYTLLADGARWLIV